MKEHERGISSQCSSTTTEALKHVPDNLTNGHHSCSTQMTNCYVNAVSLDDEEQPGNSSNDSGYGKKGTTSSKEMSSDATCKSGKVNYPISFDRSSEHITKSTQCLNNSADISKLRNNINNACNYSSNHYLESNNKNNDVELVNVTIKNSGTSNNMNDSPNLFKSRNNGSVKQADDEGLKLSNQVLGAVAGSMVHFALGAIVGLPGVVLPALVAGSDGDLVLDPEQAALFTSLSNIGAIVGSILSGPLMVWLGRRVTILAALPIAAIGWISLATSPSIWFMQLARVILGIISGIYGGPSTNYVAEISHKSVRGRLTGLVDLFRQLGFLFVYVVGSSGLSWRNTSLVCGCVTTVIPFVIFCMLPNSPRWLATKSRLPEARTSLKFYRGESYNIEQELQDITKQLELTTHGTSAKEQFRKLCERSVAKRMIVLIFLFFAYQFTGNFSMIVFSVTIFQSVHSTINEYTSTIIIGGVRVLGVACYILMADKVGRKTLLLTSLAFASVAIAVMGFFFFAVSIDYDVSSMDWMPLLSLGLFIFFTCIAEPALILLRGEILPTSVRSMGVAIIYIFFFSGAFLVSYLFPIMVNSIGSHGTFWTYALDGILMTIVGAMFLPETRGKSLEDIENIYQ